jgi:hypothetical protein
VGAFALLIPRASFFAVKWPKPGVLGQASLGWWAAAT